MEEFCLKSTEQLCISTLDSQVLGHKHHCHRSVLDLHVDHFVMEAFKIFKKRDMLILTTSEILPVDPHKQNAQSSLLCVCSAATFGMK